MHTAEKHPGAHCRVILHQLSRHVFVVGEEDHRTKAVFIDTERPFGEQDVARLAEMLQVHVVFDDDRILFDRGFLGGKPDRVGWTAYRYCWRAMMPSSGGEPASSKLA